MKKSDLQNELLPMFTQKTCMLLFLFVYYPLNVPVQFAAQEKNAKLAQKAKSIVEAAHEYISKHSDNMHAVQKALEKNPRFRDDANKLYIFMHSYDAKKGEAVCRGQGIRPELVGKNMWNLRTPNGRLIFHEFADMIEKKGQGWIEYEWLNPYTQKIQTKLSYMKKIVLKNEGNAWIGCGFWKN